MTLTSRKQTGQARKSFKTSSQILLTILLVPLGHIFAAMILGRGNQLADSLFGAGLIMLACALAVTPLVISDMRDAYRALH